MVLAIIMSIISLSAHLAADEDEPVRNSPDIFVWMLWGAFIILVVSGAVMKANWKQQHG
jgi:hypothetical protein